MQVEKNKVISFHYSLSEADGTAIESSNNSDPLAYLCGRRGILPALEDAMLGKQAGDRFSVTLTPEQAYGQRQERPAQRIPIKHLYGHPKRLKAGQTVSVNTKEGPREVIVVKVGRFNVDVDINHPLAGKTLNFDIDIVDVREASKEELAHGHAHGVGGHQR